jgi:hypothetical protein
MQNHYNLIYREEEREMIPLCLDQGVGVIPWSPLARGVLAGNRTRAGERTTTRSTTDTFTDYLYDQPTDFDVVESGAGGGGSTRRPRRRWPWRGCWGSPASRRRSSARPSRGTCRTPWRPKSSC